MKALRFALFAVVSLVLVFTAACGGASPTATSPATPAQEAQPGDSGSEEKVTLTYWSMWNETEPQAVVIQKWIDGFEAENPNITIEVVWNGRENQTKLRTALSSGTKVDFMDQDADQVAGGLMSEGYGLPLNDLLETTALDEDVPVKSVFSPGVLDLHQQDGNVYLWPYVYNAVMFWYNKTAFEAAGIQPAATWDEFISNGQKLLEAGYAPIAFESDYSDFAMYYFTYLVERAKGPGFLLSSIEDKTGELWNDPVYLEVAQMEQDLWTEGLIPEESKGYLWPQGQQTLATGDSAMELTGSWTPTELRNTTEEGFQWGGMRFPAIDGGEGSVDDVCAWLISFMVLKDTEHPQEVQQFLLWTMTKTNQQMMADEALVGTTRTDVSWPEILVDGENAAANARVAFMHGDGGPALHPEYFKNVLAFYHQDMFLGNITPEAFIEKMVSESKTYWETHDK